MNLAETINHFLDTLTREIHARDPLTDDKCCIRARRAAVAEIRVAVGLPAIPEQQELQPFTGD